MESGTAETSTQANGVANGTGAPAAETLDVHNPATGALIETIAVDSPQVVADTVARVRANQAEWEAIGIEGRYFWLGKLRDWMLDNAGRIGDTMQAETGKVRGDTTAETIYLTDLINFYGTKAAKFIGDETVRPHSALAASKKLMVQYRPYPVVGVISPWNFPLAICAGMTTAALVTGNTVIVKPAEQTPGIARIMCDILHEALDAEKLPRAVLQFCPAPGETTGAALVRDSRVALIAFTGSRAVGLDIVQAAGTTPKGQELRSRDSRSRPRTSRGHRMESRSCFAWRYRGIRVAGASRVCSTRSSRAVRRGPSPPTCRPVRRKWFAPIPTAPPPTPDRYA